MKSDLDRLMAERNYDALVVTGATLHNAPMYYLANGVSIGERTVLVKKRGETPILFVNSMERDEAAKSGLPIVDSGKYKMTDLIKDEKGDRLRASGRWYGKVFAEAGVSGRILLAGNADRGDTLRLSEALEEMNPGITLVGETTDESIFTLASSTKDADEVKRIRAVGKKTMRVVGNTADFLVSQRAKNGYLVRKDGSRVTVGDVKREINRWLMEEGIVDAEAGTIFATGRDAGVPHSRGEAKAPLRLGQTIVYDIFPAEPGGGYFYDFTRTWCLGYAPEHIQKVYDDVLGVFKAVSKSLTPNSLCNSYQKLVCDYFEARGHTTIQTNPATTTGYVHSLGHGIGLHVHEAPNLRDVEGHTELLVPGAVFTIEPGLYYPDHPGGGFGVRLEDSVWLNPDTLKFETLASYPKDLVLPVKEMK